jgi:molybdopterin biosynthesis enzyme
VPFVKKAGAEQKQNLYIIFLPKNQVKKKNIFVMNVNKISILNKMNEENYQKYIDEIKRNQVYQKNIEVLIKRIEKLEFESIELEQQRQENERLRSENEEMKKRIAILEKAVKIRNQK